MIYFLGAVILVIMLVAFKKSGHFFRSVITSVLGGVGALCAVSAVSYVIPLTVGINAYSLVFGAVFSVPGVIFMLLAQSFLFCA